MARKNLRVGLVGVGAAAQISHIPALLKSEGVELVALCDRDPEKAARVAQKFSIPRHVSRIDGLLSDDSIDAIDICGDAQLVSDAVAAYEAAGVDHAIVMPLPWGPDRAAIVDDTIVAAAT